MSLTSNLTINFPPGYAEQYIGYVSRDVAVSFTVLEIVFTSLRFLCQRLGTKSFGFDDWLMLPALAFCLGLNAATLVFLKVAPVGYHTAVVAADDPKAFVIFDKLEIVGPPLYSIACSFPRLAILTLYLRVLTRRWHRAACFTLIASVIAMALTDFFLSTLYCVPVSKIWDKTIPGHCLNVTTVYRWGTLPNIIIDAFMLVLPLPVVRQLNASGRVKLGLVITFLTGSIGLVASIMRTAAWFIVDPNEDVTWSSVTFVNWSIIEPGIYLIAACLPCYKPLLNLMLRGDAKKRSERAYAAPHPVILSDIDSKSATEDDPFTTVEERSVSIQEV